MCGRFTLAVDPEALQLAFKVLSIVGCDLPRYNVAPSQQAAVISNRDPQNLAFMQWGLVPSWAKHPKIGSRMINARQETAAEKPSFRAALKRRRCLIPADGFYEWLRQGKKKTPVYIHRYKRELFAFAGLWETWKKPDDTALHSFTILTTAANEKLRPIHHRMPVIIEPENYETWLSPRELLPAERAHLMTGSQSDKLTFHEVSPAVNRPANDYPALILPYQAASQQTLL